MRAPKTHVSRIEMKPFFAIVGVIGVLFMLRVLAALLRESRGKRPTPLTVHFSKFIPAKKHGELIVINHEARNQKFTHEARRAAFVIAALIMLTPLVRGQETASQAPASAKEVQELRDLVRQLQAKVDKLEGEQKKAGKDPSAQPAATTSTEGTSQTPAVADAAFSGATPTSKPPQKKQKVDPFSFADFTWLNVNPRT